MPPGSRITTEFVKLTERYFAELGIPVRVAWSYGATEAKVPEIVDAIVDITETGSTLRAHGMKIIETLLDVRAGAGGEPARRPRTRRSAPRWTTSPRCCWGRCRPRAGC